MGMFGEYKEMTAYTEEGRIDCTEMIRRTKDAIKNGKRVICEAAFSADSLYCAVDILKREDQSDTSEPTYSMYEVKNAPEVEPWFILDASFQYYVASRSVKIDNVVIVTHGENDTFETMNVNRLVFGTQKGISTLIDHVKAAIESSKEPTIQCGKDCEEPYRCLYWDYCQIADK